jgi:tetratricopeptide (TPR) repeat protein
VERIGTAVEAMSASDWARARGIFAEVADAAGDEPELADRARTYAKICERRMAPKLAEPSDNEERYYRAVMLVNSGDPREAIRLLDLALREDPTSVRCLYARASAWALEGKVDQAVADLRQAVAADPRVRYQASNDADFEKVREEPSFIDLIEPTPTGA